MPLFSQRSPKEIRRKHETKLFFSFECCLFVLDFVFYYFILTPALWNATRARMRQEGIFLFKLPHCCLCLSDFHIFFPPTLKLQPIASVICSYVKPTIWQSRRSKPKQGCTDSWRLSCKIKQKNKLLLLLFFPRRLEVVSSPSASTVSYLESVYF